MSMSINTYIFTRRLTYVYKRMSTGAYTIKRLNDMSTYILDLRACWHTFVYIRMYICAYVVYLCVQTYVNRCVNGAYMCIRH